MQFIACAGACVVELKRCDALENRFKIEGDANLEPIASPHIPLMEEMLETLENLGKKISIKPSTIGHILKLKMGSDRILLPNHIDIWLEGVL